MVDAAAAGIAAAVVLVICIVAAAVWYFSAGWKPFSFSAGDVATWKPAPGKPVQNLRFRKCKFTVVRSDDVTASTDVTARLNAMAKGLTSAKANYKPPAQLALVAALNPFSFVIPKFNEPGSITTDPASVPWCIQKSDSCAKVATVTLTGMVRTL